MPGESGDPHAAEVAVARLREVVGPRRHPDRREARLRVGGGPRGGCGRREPRTTTLVAVSHGTSDPRGQGAIRRLVEGIRDRLPGVDVRQAFVDVEAPDLPSVLADVDGPVTVVPLLLGAGFHVHVDIATAVDARIAAGQPTTTAPTLGPDPAITGLLLDRLQRRRSGAGRRRCAGRRRLQRRPGSAFGRPRRSDARDGAAATRPRRAPGRRRSTRLNRSSLRHDARSVEHGRGRVIAANYLLAPGFFAVTPRRELGRRRDGTAEQRRTAR